MTQLVSQAFKSEKYVRMRHKEPNQRTTGPVKQGPVPSWLFVHEKEVVLQVCSRIFPACKHANAARVSANLRDLPKWEDVKSPDNQR